jgi:PAS domain S-box-containing protein
MAKHREFAGDRTVSGDAILDGIAGNDTGLLDAVDLPIIVVNRDCTIVRINRAAITVLGLKLTDVGRSVGDSLSGVENLGRVCARVLADGAPHRTEAREGDRFFLVRIAPYSGSDRQILGAVLTFTNVTAFRASLDQAIYEREYTKAILNAVTDPLVVLDDKLHVQTANRVFHNLFDLSRGKAQGVSIRKLGNDEWEMSDAWASVEASLCNHTEVKAIEIEGELPVVGRRTFALEARKLAPDRNALILLTLHDITERKQAERTNSLLAAIVDCSDDAIISKKLDGTITSWNKSAERLFGYTADEATGQPITLIVPWERRSEEEGILRRLARGERVDHFETVRKRKDGTTVEVSLTISPIRDGAGRVIGASKVARDITERKRIEQALLRSEERFRALVNASSDVVYHMSPDWSEMRQLDGKGFIADTGKPRKDWLNEYIDVADQPLMLRTIREAVRTKTMFKLEHRVRRTDGTLGWTYSRAVPLLDENGAIMGWFGAASDVTARKMAEENYRTLAQTLDAQVRARTKELEERNADVLRQAAQVTELSRRLLHTQDEERRHIARELHDSAGQTLTVLGMNLAQLVQKASRVSPGLATVAENTQDLVQQLHREIRTASYLLHPPLLDESGLSSALSWYIEGLRERSDLDIRLRVPEELGRLPADMELVIFRVVQECLTNIHRHSESKTALIRVSRDPEKVILEVQDSGRGMSPEKLAELQSRGSGVGIRGMHERVRQLGGDMSIESDNSGTRILVNIPTPKTELRQEPVTMKALDTAI